MAGVVLETLSTKKLIILSVSLLILLSVFFLIGGIIGKIKVSLLGYPFSLIKEDTRLDFKTCFLSLKSKSSSGLEILTRSRL